MQSYQLKTIQHHSAPPAPRNPSSWRITVDLDYSVVVIGVVAVLRHNDHRPVSANRTRTDRVQARRRLASALVVVAKSRNHLGNRRVQRDRLENGVSLAALPTTEVSAPSMFSWICCSVEELVLTRTVMPLAAPGANVIVASFLFVEMVAS
jgi:hypothetical protein